MKQMLTRKFDGAEDFKCRACGATVKATGVHSALSPYPHQALLVTPEAPAEDPWDGRAPWAW